MLCHMLFLTIHLMPNVLCAGCPRRSDAGVVHMGTGDPAPLGYEIKSKSREQGIGFASGRKVC